MTRFLPIRVQIPRIRVCIICFGKKPLPVSVSSVSQVAQLDSQTPQESVATLYVMKSRQLQDVVVDSIYKSKDIGGGRVAGQQTEDVFHDVRAQ